MHAKTHLSALAFATVPLASCRAALDQQLAAKNSRHQQEMTEETERAIAELQKVQQSLVTAAQASRSSKQRSIEALRQQLDEQMLQSKKAKDY